MLNAKMHIYVYMIHRQVVDINLDECNHQESWNRLQRVKSSTSKFDYCLCLGPII
jgi:hypothetical protein